MEAKILNRSGNSTTHKVTFEAKDVLPINHSQAMEAQRALGYDPMGYDFFGFKCQATDGGYVAVWYCDASCGN